MNPASTHKSYRNEFSQETVKLFSFKFTVIEYEKLTKLSSNPGPFIEKINALPTELKG